MIEDQIKELGFALVKQYPHDVYHTNRYKRGPLEVEFTYEKKKLISCDLTIDEVVCKPITFDELIALNAILGGVGNGSGIRDVAYFSTTAD